MNGTDKVVGASLVKRFTRQEDRCTKKCLNGGACALRNGVDIVCGCVTGTSGEFCENSKSAIASFF